MLTVTDYDSYLQALEFINGSDMLAYDTETTGLNPRKDKVIGFGVSNGLDGFYVPLLAYQVKEKALVAAPALVQRLHVGILESLAKRKLIMFNASFDARFTLYNFGIDLIPALHTDVLLLKHTCDEDFPFGLKEIATKLWGHDVKKEKEAMQASIKANGGRPTDYFKADANLLGEYCVQDCILTFKIYNYYLPRLKRDGLDSFFYTEEVMPLYRTVTIPMEMRGVALDMPKLQTALQDIVVDIAKLESEIQRNIDPLLQAWKVDYLNKEYPLVTPKGNKTKLGKFMDKYEYTDAYKCQYEAWQNDNPGVPSLFNLNSKHHLKALFFDILKEKPLGHTPAGQPQVDDEFIQSMAAKYPWCSKLTDYNKLIKIKGTYIERFLSEAEDGIFYPSFYQHRTVSGRYASDLQQMPRPIKGDGVVARYTSMLRSFIIARPGHQLISADYESLEPKVFAHVSGDPALVDIFNSGKDFYSEICIRTERVPNVSSDKKAPNYLGAVMPERRQTAKAYALGIAYGLTGYKLQFELNIPQEDAERLVNDYLNAFPKLKEWMHASKDKATVIGNIRSQAGRMRRVPQAVDIFRRYGSRIFNSLQLYQDYNQTPGLYAQAKADRKTIVNLCNNAINFQIQGLAASIVNRAAIKINAEIKQRDIPAECLINVHDQLVYEAPDSYVADVKEIMQRHMENNYTISVPLKAEPISARSFDACK